MALTATIYNFDVDLSDSDRGVYETVSLRVAQHPSESDEYLIARVLAYLLEYSRGHRVFAGCLGARRADDFGARSHRQDHQLD
jgi:uncharacterized protein YaeQ